MLARYFAPAVLCVLLSLPLAAVADPANLKTRNDELAGTVQSGETRIPSAIVSLYRAGRQHRGAGAVRLGRTRSDTSGSFRISYTPPPETSVLYLVAEGPRAGRGRSPVTLAAVLDPTAIPHHVIINERATVATAYAMAQFTNGRSVGGTSPGLRNAAATAQNLVDLGRGDVGGVLRSAPNGEFTSTMRTFNSLANLLATCVQSATSCDALFAAATPPRGGAPRDTLQAIVNIAHHPWQHVADLFTLSQESALYQPALDPGAGPDAWTLAIRYHGSGPEGQRINGPGNIAFDRDGNAWVTNNYRFDLDPAQTVCGSDKVLKLTPTGGSAPGAPYSGGGLYGAGFGIALDPDGNVWVGNFGFQGTGCPLPYRDLAKSISKFGADGIALSPVGGFRRPGTFDQPQGTVSDRQGNIWVANCSGQSVTLIPGGNPDHMWNIHGIGSKPFDIAIDTRGHAWVTVNNAPTGNEQGFPSGIVIELAPDGSVVGDPVTGAHGIRRPMGIATDSRGNVWVANSGVFDPPCEDTLAGDAIAEDIGDDGERNDKAAVTLIRPLGTSRRVVTTFGKEDGPRGGLALPWGIAIDGDDNVWVANFAGQRLTQLCGVRRQHCPPGKRTGDAISPDTGYGSDALVRNTGVQIDPSGNVWLTNNWIQDAFFFQTNPGGHELVVFIGLAAPIKTPLIGPPSTP